METSFRFPADTRRAYHGRSRRLAPALRSGRMIAGLCEVPSPCLCRLFRFTVGAKGQHPPFASHLERDAVEREIFGGRIDFGSLVVKLDCDGESHATVRTSALLCANSVQVATESLFSLTKVVPTTGLEPVRCYSLEPESSASANSATWAPMIRRPF